MERKKHICNGFHLPNSHLLTRKASLELNFIIAISIPTLESLIIRSFIEKEPLISFYAGVEDSEHVIKHAHELRNANPLLHASSQLLDRNDTSEDLRESIKALSTLIYGYIDNHREHT